MPYANLSNQGMIAEYIEIKQKDLAEVVLVLVIIEITFFNNYLKLSDIPLIFRLSTYNY